MGWTNSVPIFHDNVTHILQSEIPHTTIPYIDDVPIKGPNSTYQDDQGNYETIPTNSGIWRFVWEHFQNLNRVVQHMKYSGGSFSGYKSNLSSHEKTLHSNMDPTKSWPKKTSNKPCATHQHFERLTIPLRPL